ncbi:MAG TPA: hypothetical protein VHM31_15840 [Polyangia bacterium]|nr:hypothetical protein [Polyangia bacterium]
MTGGALSLARLLLAGVLSQALPMGDDGALPPTPVESARRARRTRPPDPARLRLLFAEDPPVAVLRQAATALLGAEPERARSALARARLAGWLPELRVLVERKLGRSESVDLGTAADPTAVSPVGIDTSNDVRYQARATWDLSKIVFNPDEIAVEVQALRAADARREIEGAIVRLYFERRRLKVESLETDDWDMPSGFRRDLRIAEVEAELDALTGGAFTRLARRYSAEGNSR